MRNFEKKSTQKTVFSSRYVNAWQRKVGNLSQACNSKEAARPRQPLPSRAALQGEQRPAARRASSVTRRLQQPHSKIKRPLHAVVDFFPKATMAS